MNFYKDTAPTVVTNNGDKVRIDDMAVGLVEIIDNGTKNLLNLSKGTASVPTGVSYTINSDKSVTVTWNTSSTVSLRFNGIPHIDGKLVMSGCPIGGGTSTYLMQIRQGDTTISNTSDTGEGSPEFELPSGTFDLIFRLAAGSFTKTFYPMLLEKCAWDISKKYIPYQYPALPIMFNETNAITRSNTLAETGLTFTIPANVICRITAGIITNNNLAQKLQLLSGDVVIAEATPAATGSLSITAVAIAGPHGSSRQIKLLGQWTAAGVNRAIMIVEQLAVVS